MLGYVLSIQDVVHYYSKPGIQEAIFQAGHDRDTITVLDTGMLSRGRGNAPGFSQPEDIPQIAQQSLQNQQSTVPRKYPAFHGTVGRFSNTELFRRGRTFIGSDMVFDIDAKTDYRKAFCQGKRIVEFLDGQKVTYRIKFSGGTGPHIILPCETLPQRFSSNRFKRLFRKICEQSKIELENVDFSLTSPKHFLRLPYSLNEYTGLVSLPLTRDTFEDFEPGIAESSHITIDNHWFQIPEDAHDQMQRLISDILGRRDAS